MDRSSTPLPASSRMCAVGHKGQMKHPPNGIPYRGRFAAWLCDSLDNGLTGTTTDPVYSTAREESAGSQRSSAECDTLPCSSLLESPASLLSRRERTLART